MYVYVCVYVCMAILQYISFIDADFDSPLQLTGPGSAQKFVPDEGSVSMIESMGFTRRQATFALKATVSTCFYIWTCLSTYSAYF